MSELPPERRLAPSGIPVFRKPRGSGPGEYSHSTLALGGMSRPGALAEVIAFPRQGG
jgi:hypothetical protein